MYADQTDSDILRLFFNTKPKHQISVATQMVSKFLYSTELYYFFNWCVPNKSLSTSAFAIANVDLMYTFWTAMHEKKCDVWFVQTKFTVTHAPCH